MIQWAIGGSLVYGGLTYAAHMLYPPVTRINFRFKVIPVCMATLATSYFRAEQVLNDCRRENTELAHVAEMKQRSAAWAARKQHAAEHHQTATEPATSPKRSQQNGTKTTVVEEEKKK